MENNAKVNRENAIQSQMIFQDFVKLALKLKNKKNQV
jgi:hypothetical protein